MEKKDLLFEIYTEEIPPFELYKLNDFLKSEIEKFLKENEISFENPQLFSTPRRVAFKAENVSSKQEDKEVTVYGPYKKIAFDENNNPTKALQGFLKGKGKTLDDILFQKDKKGERIYFKDFVKGKNLDELLNDFLEFFIKKAPFKKSMKWGTNKYTFIRPIHGILALYGEQTLNLKFENLKSSNKTKGHPILIKKDIEIKSPSSYEETLKNNYVIPSLNERKQIILKQIKDLEEKNNFKVIVDEYLLKEVVNIVEYPVCFVGTFNDEFLILPPEVLELSMKKHQKYFPVYNKENKITNHFLGIANVPVKDSIVSGNERVLKARLSDAKFFYEDDLKKGLEILIPKLKDVLFQAKLGTYADKIKRVEYIALKLNETLNLNLSEEKIKKSASLIKTDLLTGMVGEFAGLQGIIGTHYALKLGIEEDIALTIMEHYQPKTVNDEVPQNELSVLMALSDKLDSLVGGFMAGLAPTGSKDPFALRRASLSILKILTQREENTELKNYFIPAIQSFSNKQDEELLKTLVNFFKERFKFFLKSQYKPDVVEAVISNSDIINGNTVKLCDALNNFKNDKKSKELILLIKRIKNILKEDLGNIDGKINEDLFQTEEEKNLYDWLKKNTDILFKLFKENEFKKAFETSLGAYELLDKFFDKVLVNDKNPDLKKNRQLLLNELYSLFTKFVSIEKLVIG